MRRLDSLLLTGVAVLLVHQLAYTASSLAGVKTAVAHGHLEIAWLFGSLSAIAALARAVTRSLRRRRHTPGGTWSFTAWILTGYLTLETLERVANGLAATSLLSEPVFWLGLVLAPLVAAVLSWSMRTVAQLVADALVKRRAWEPENSTTTSLGNTSISLPSPLFSFLVVSPRGPPLLVSFP